MLICYKCSTYFLTYLLCQWDLGTTLKHFWYILSPENRPCNKDFLSLFVESKCYLNQETRRAQRS